MPDDTNMAIDGIRQGRGVGGASVKAYDARGSGSEKFELRSDGLERPAPTVALVERVWRGEISVEQYLRVRRADATRHLEDKLTPAMFGFVSEALRDQVAHDDPVTADLIRRATARSL